MTFIGGFQLRGNFDLRLPNWEAALVRLVLSDAQWNGSEWRHFFLARRVIRAGRQRATGCFWRRRCGPRALACRAAAFQGRSETEIQPPSASGGGCKRAHSKSFSRPYPATPISNTLSSTALLFGATSMEPRQKGESKSGHWPIARQLDRQDRGAGRCSRQSRAVPAAARTMA